MRQIEELPQHESLAVSHRYLICNPNPDGSPLITRKAKPENPETIFACSQDGADGMRGLSRGVFLNREWRISYRSAGKKSDVYGVARNRDEALAATMDAADIAFASLSGGAFGRIAERYQHMLEKRIALLRRDDVEKATEAMPIRQILPSSRRWHLRRRLYHSAPHQEILTLTEGDGLVPRLTLIGNAVTWHCYVRNWEPHEKISNGAPLLCLQEALSLLDECSGHEKIDLSRMFHDALDGLVTISDAVRHFGCDVLINPFHQE